MAELDRRAHLASLDQVGMRLENGIDFLAVRDLLAIEHTATCLINHTAPQLAKVLDLFAELFDGHVGEHVPAAHLVSLLERRSRVPHDLFGNADELAICPSLLLVALPCRHAPAIAKPLDLSQFQPLGQAADQARDHAHHIPQQRVVGRMMDVGLHHRGVDPQLPTVLQSELDRRPNHQVVDGFERLRRQSDKAALNRSSTFASWGAV
jgi:hypothetical protein